jgi:uncharacterized RDD family membrane protein YckC
VEDDALRFSHSGRRYVLGFGQDFFGIWDREWPNGPVERFPRSDEGWRDAWVRFAALEDSWVEVGVPRIKGITTGGEVLASPLSRLGARVMDGLLVAVVLSTLVAGGAVEIDSVSPQTFPTRLIGVTLLVGFVYETTFIALRGQTLGKMAVRIRVVRQHDGATPGWGPSFVRWLVPVLASIVPFGALVVYLWMLWGPRRQGLHDRAARTLVVAADRSGV